MQNGTYCASSTTAVTCTTTGEGCVNGSTVTCNAGQFCQQPYPMSQCAPPTAVGFYNDLQLTQSHGAGALSGFAITTTSAVTLYRFGAIMRNVSGTRHMRFALYDTNGAVPHKRIAQSVELTLATGRNEVAPSASGITLAASTTYYLMMVLDTTTDAADDGSTSTTWHFANHAYLNPLPDYLNPIGTETGPPTSPQPGLSNMSAYILVY
jgi:hypothetical protein